MSQVLPSTVKGFLQFGQLGFGIIEGSFTLSSNLFDVLLKMQALEKTENEMENRLKVDWKDILVLPYHSLVT